MAKFTFNKFQENVASVVKIEALASGTTIEPHTVVSIAPCYRHHHCNKHTRCWRFLSLETLSRL